MYYNYDRYQQDDRFVPFIAPFLLGGLGGAAVVAAARPRPIYGMPAPYYGTPYRPMPMPYYGGY